MLVFLFCWGGGGLCWFFFFVLVGVGWGGGVFWCFVIFCLLAFAKAEENSQSCDICKYVVSTVEQYINASEAEIEKKLVQACGLLPPQYQQMCDTVVLLYGHTIIQYIVKYENASVVCAQLKLCTAKVEPATLVKTEEVQSEVRVPAAVASDAKCTICVFVVSSVENYISTNKTEKEITDALAKLCNKLPQQYGTQCTAIVNEYTPYIIYYLKEKFPADKICKTLGLCTATKEVEAEEVNPLPSCYLCQYVIQYVEQMVPANASEQQIIDALNQVCDYVPVLFQSQCKNFTQQYLDQVVHLIIKKAPASEICEFIKLCTPSRKSPKAASSPLICNGCKHLVAVASNFITKNTTEQEIVRIVEKACEFFPEQYKGLCKIVVEQYGPAIISKLAQQYFDPDQVCTAVKACTSRFNVIETASNDLFGVKIN
jgi:saposin